MSLQVSSLQVFQSSLPRGERLLEPTNIQRHVKFQSSLPRGERRVRVTYCTSCGNISILAPTRGATNSEAGNNRGIRFQSSLPRGERLAIFFGISNKKRFQSSLPRGERQLPCVTGALLICLYQSSLPRGERQVTSGYCMQTSRISILAPTRGATKTTGADRPETTNFNPRSHEGSDSNFRQKVLFSLSKNCLKYLILTTNYFN